MFRFLIRYYKPRLVLWHSSTVPNGSNRIDEFFLFKTTKFNSQIKKRDNSLRVISFFLRFPKKWGANEN